MKYYIFTGSFKTYTVRAMKKFKCIVCGYVYDPVEGDPDAAILPGTPFDEIPDDWMCPLCGVTKEDFEPAD